MLRLLGLVSLSVAAFCAQDVRPKDVRETAKGGSAAFPKLDEYLTNSDPAVRLEAVKQIIEIPGVQGLDLLVKATRDNDPEVQLRAVEGLVNFYVSGYAKSGFSASIARVGTSIRSRFTDTNDQIVDPYVQVRPDVIAAIAPLIRGGNGVEVRAAAARAAGVLRGKAAVPELVDALKTKDAPVLYEAVVALGKIRDESAGPRMTFVVRDPDPKVQLAAIDAAGVLRNMQAIPELTDVLNHTRNQQVRRAALGALAMLPDEKNRPMFQQYLADKDEKMRAAAAEGVGRLRNPADLGALENAYKSEGKTPARLSMAFAEVMLGRVELSEFSPLQYLINNLNSNAYKGEAVPFLSELAREARVRTALYPALDRGTKDERIGLARVFAASGDAASKPYMDRLSRDPDPDVAQEGIRALRSLQARL